MGHLMSEDNVITLIGIGANIIVAIGGVVVSYLNTRRQLRNNDIDTNQIYIQNKADVLQEKACRYWGKLNLLPDDKLMLECEIKGNISDIKRILERLHKHHSRIKEHIHKIQTDDIIELDKLITNGTFETPNRVADAEKCKQITEKIAHFKHKISTIL